MAFNSVLLVSFVNLALILFLIVTIYKIKLRTEKKICSWCEYNIFAFSIIGILILLKILSEAGILNMNFPSGVILMVLFLFLIVTNYLLAQIMSSIATKKRRLRFK